jgi:hypothetical protein
MTAQQAGFSSVSASSIVPTERGYQFTKVGSDSFKAVSEKALSFQDAADTWVLRSSLVWKTDLVAGDSLFNTNLPWGMLKLNNANCQQTMLFERFVFHYFRTMDIRIQVNGSPFQSGMLYGYYDPRNEFQTTSIYDVPAFDFIHRIPPHTNASYEFNIPFTFHRSRLNSNLATFEESIGRFLLVVVDPLFTTGTDVNLSVFTKFSGYVCTVPRASINGVYTLEGIGGSKPTTNIFNLRHSTVGAMPIEMNMSGNAGKGEGEFSTTLPMDKPPLASGALPVFIQNPGMSNCVGVMPCTALQLSPAAMRPTSGVFATDVDHMSIDSLCARKYQIYQRLWADTDLAGTLLVSLPITPMPKAATNQSGGVLNVKFCALEAIVDLASFWWGEITYEIVVIANNFHTGAIRVAYNYAGESLNSLKDVETTYNSTFDISNGNHIFTVTIPPNAGTDWLSTEGTSKPFVDPSNRAFNNIIPNRRLGFLNLYVLNPLRSATPTVPPDCEVLIYMSCKLSLAVPRAFPVWGSSVNWTYLVPASANSERRLSFSDDDYALESPGEPGVTSVSTGDSAYGTGEIGSKNTEELHAERNVINVSDNSLTHSPNRDAKTEKFQFKICSLVDLFKRYVPITVERFNCAATAAATTFPGSAYIVPLTYPKFARSLFSGLKGGIHVRAMFRASGSAGFAGFVNYVPAAVSGEFRGSLDGKNEHVDSAYSFTGLLAGFPNISGVTFTRVTPPAVKATLTSGSFQNCMGARDVLFVDRHGMVDYYCPFQNIYDYWPMGSDEDDNRVGTLYFYFPTLASTLLVGFWQCVGDDFAGCRFSPTTVANYSASQFNIKGFVADDRPPLVLTSTVIQSVTTP